MRGCRTRKKCQCRKNPEQECSSRTKEERCFFQDVLPAPSVYTVLFRISIGHTLPTHLLIPPSQLLSWLVLLVIFYSWVPQHCRRKAQSIRRTVTFTSILYFLSATLESLQNSFYSFPSTCFTLNLQAFFHAPSGDMFMHVRWDDEKGKWILMSTCSCSSPHVRKYGCLRLS